MLRIVSAWISDTFADAKYLGVFQLAGLAFLSIMFGVQWILTGEAWSRHYDQSGWTALRHAWLPFIPDIMESGSLGNFMATWFLLISALMVVGFVIGIFLFPRSEPDRHSDFVVKCKEECLDYNLESGLLTIGVAAFSGGTVSSTLLVFLSARNFLTVGMTQYVTPYFLVVNTLFGTVVMSMLGLLACSYTFWIAPMAWAKLMGTFVGNPDHGVMAVAAAIFFFWAPLVGAAGIFAGALNSALMGFGLASWVWSFVPGRRAVRNAYRRRGVASGATGGEGTCGGLSQ